MIFATKKVTKPIKSTRRKPDLPLQVGNFIASLSRPSLMQRFSYGGVTKSWSPSPKQCHPIGKLPWPQLSATNNRNGDESRDQTHQQCFNIFIHKGSIWWIGKRPNENLPSLPLYFVVTLMVH